MIFGWFRRTPVEAPAPDVVMLRFYRTPAVAAYDEDNGGPVRRPALLSVWTGSWGLIDDRGTEMIVCAHATEAGHTTIMSSGLASEY